MTRRLTDYLCMKSLDSVYSATNLYFEMIHGFVCIYITAYGSFDTLNGSNRFKIKRTPIICKAFYCKH